MFLKIFLLTQCSVPYTVIIEISSCFDTYVYACERRKLGTRSELDFARSQEVLEVGSDSNHSTLYFNVTTNIYSILNKKKKTSKKTYVRIVYLYTR